MIRLFYRSFALVALLLVVVSPTALAQPQALTATAESSVTVLGDSTLHKWTAKATQLQISAVAVPGRDGLWVAVQSGRLRALSLLAPVAGLKSNEGGKMDKNMRAALEAEKFSETRFVMAGYEIKEGELLARGALTIHGVSKDVELKGKVTGDAESVELKGSYDLLMSAYGIKPPVMMLGTLRVADKVSIAYDFTLRMKP